MMLKRFVRNILSNWTAFFADAVIGFIMAPFLIHRLGNSYYGLWIILQSFVGYLGILDIGIKPALVKYVAEFNAQKKFKRLSQYVNTCFFMYLLIGIVTLALVIVLSNYLPFLINVSIDMRMVTETLVIIVGVQIALSFPFSIFSGMLPGLQRYDLDRTIRLSFRIANAILVIMFLSHGYGIISLAFIGLATSLSSDITYSIVVRKLCPYVRITYKNFKRSDLRVIFNYSVTSFVVVISWRILFWTDSIVIGHFKSAAVVTYYAIASNLIRYFRDFLFGFSYVFTPAISEMKALEHTDKVRKTVLEGTRAASMIVFPIAIFLIVCGDKFISLWIGSGYEESYMILYILVLAQMISLPQHISEAYLFGVNEQRTLAFVLSGEAALNLALSIALVKPLGIIGVALGTLIPHLIVYIGWFPVYICKKLGISLKKYALDSFGLPFVLSVLYLAVLVYFRNVLLDTKSWLNLIAVFMASGTVYLVLAYNFYLKALLKRGGFKYHSESS